MIEAPYDSFEVVMEVLPANAAKFCQAQFGVAPEGLNAVKGYTPQPRLETAVDMTTVSGKFIVVMVDAMVLIAFHHQIDYGRSSLTSAFSQSAPSSPITLSVPS